MIIDRLAKTPRSPRTTRALARRLGGLVAAGALTSLSACTAPPIDTNQPTVTGVIEGSVQYIGRRVDCDYVDGVPTRVHGRILMTLNDVDNPLPPAGTATQPADFFAIGGEDIFNDLPADCLPLPAVPANPAADAAARAVNIQRAVHFRWGLIKMGSVIPAAQLDADGNATQAVKDEHAKHYTIQGFYDQEGDFNPLFSVAQSTTAGDIAGGALQDPLASTAFRDIRFESVTLEPLGTLIDTVNVTLAAPVVTDPPIFRVENGAISAESAIGFPPLLGLPQIDLTLYERTAAGNDARTRFDATSTALNRGGFADFANPLQYAWYVAPVDVDGSGDADCPLGGGDADCHPLMGSFGIEWNSPVVLMQRFKTAIETEANIPTVALIPNAGMEASNPATQYPDVALRVFPFAAVLPNPLHSECQAAYFVSSPSNAAVIGPAMGQLPPGSILECNELPTGYFSVNGLGGYVGTPATRVCINNTDPGCASYSPANTETGIMILNGQFGAQVWQLPNELGDAAQVGDEVTATGTHVGPRQCLAPGDAVGTPLCLPEQSVRGAVVVHDPNTSNAFGRRDPAAAVPGGACTQYDFSVNPWTDNPAVETDFNDLCCRPILHLCNVPLCPYVAGGTTPTWADTPAEQNVNIRSTPTRIVSHATVTIEGVRHTYGVPDCIPFPMPAQCCPNAQTSAP